MAQCERFRVFVYRRTGNLGDAIQTLALSRLLGPGCVGVYRDSPIPAIGRELPLIANGWLGHRPPGDVRLEAVFAGVHLGRHEKSFAEWLRHSPNPVGARDPFTQGLLRLFGIESRFTGCATLTLEPYRGARWGRFAVDAVGPGATVLTNGIPDLDWPTQWSRAVELLELLRRAEVVYTTRLHVALPCLAFGTPVVFPSSGFDGVAAKERLSILFGLPFVLDEPVTACVTAHAEAYVNFLTAAVGPLATSTEAALPPPIAG